MLECDLVMKGGVTSGTVYPKAIAELSKTYRFRGIGGTSAGAIAAAAAAAAEFRRQSSPDRASRSGFAVLEELPVRLGRPGKKGYGSSLLELFQPQPRQRRLFRFLLSFVGRCSPERRGQTGSSTLSLTARALVRAIRYFPGAALLGAVLSLAMAWSLGFSGARPWSWPVLGVVTFVGAAAVALLGAWRELLDLPANDFGMCRGFERARDREDPTHLTAWLHAMLQETAGLAEGDPLTFGRLRAEGVDLRVMTSNLGYGRPHQLPLRPSEAWAFFDERVWAEIFPADVVAHLKSHPPARYRQAKDDDAYAAAVDRIREEQGLLPLPDADDLPVIVAVRLSLSFPILLSAVPVWFLDPPHKDKGLARRCWLSDGGISSNFPLHFFDAPIPSRPTFAINLQEVDASFEGERVWLAETNRDGLERQWLEIDNARGPAALAKFLVAILDVMQNWRDNSLLPLPGYRDRVVAVRLQPHEGGLNLTMPPDLVDALAGYGHAAAKKLVLHFDPANEARRRAANISTSWDNHRWVRLLSALAGMDTLAREFQAVWDVPPTADKSYQDLLDPGTTRDQELPSYQGVTEAQRRFALASIIGIRQVLDEQRARFGAGSLRDNTPRPPLRFRLTHES
jgi:predicted acylesterase/phospholipase RssA